MIKIKSLYAIVMLSVITFSGSGFLVHGKEEDTSHKNTTYYNTIKEKKKLNDMTEEELKALADKFNINTEGLSKEEIIKKIKEHKKDKMKKYDFDKMSEEELKKFAEKAGIDTKDMKKDEIINKLKEYKNEKIKNKLKDMSEEEIKSLTEKLGIKTDKLSRKQIEEKIIEHFKNN